MGNCCARSPKLHTSRQSTRPHSKHSAPHPEPSLTINDFQIIALLGEGGFGRVFKVSPLPCAHTQVRMKESGALYALKTVRKKDTNNALEYSSALAERDALARFDSPFLPKYFSLSTPN